MRAGAAALDAAVARAAADAGIAGLEFLRGIPGTIGGALRMNAGCYGREIKDIFVEATAIDGKGDKHVARPPPTWASSIANPALPDDLIFVEARVRRHAGRAGRDPRAHERAGRAARSLPAGEIAHRRFDVQESARATRPGS